MKPVEQKSHLYKTISTLNRAFAFVLHSFEALEESGIFRRKYMRMFKNKARELQAHANEEILEALKEREEADFQRFGELVRAFDRQYEDPVDSLPRPGRGKHQSKKKPSKRRDRAVEINSKYYVSCWTEDDGIYSCGHEHESVKDALRCCVPDGRSFIRACESGVFRSLNETEFGYFLVALSDMPWRSSGWSD